MNRVIVPQGSCFFRAYEKYNREVTLLERSIISIDPCSSETSSRELLELFVQGERSSYLPRRALATEEMSTRSSLLGIRDSRLGN